MATFFSLTIWLGLALLVGSAASKRKRGWGRWFLFALIISPVIAGIAVVLAGENKTLSNDEVSRLKKLQQDYIELYCANEITIKTNRLLNQKFLELTRTNITRNSEISSQDIEKYIDILLDEVADHDCRLSSNTSDLTSVQIDTLDILEKLKELLDKGVLTTDEFSSQKAKILERI